MTGVASGLQNLSHRATVTGFGSERREKMKRLFVYGTLCPGRENAFILEKPFRAASLIFLPDKTNRHVT
jgi:hypothetical protein